MQWTYTIVNSRKVKKMDFPEGIRTPRSWKKTKAANNILKNSTLHNPRKDKTKLLNYDETVDSSC